MGNNLKILCLMTMVRGGSKLFHSLLDWHPQIISFPRTLQFNRFWQSVEHRRDNLEYVIDSFIEMYPRFFSGECWYRFNKYDKADQLGPNRNETFSVDVDLFRKKAIADLRDIELTRASLFISLHVAYHTACGRELIEDSLILYHIHEIDLQDELNACLLDFPNTRLLIMTRHPIEGLNSCLNWMKMQNTLSCLEQFHHQKQALLGTKNLTEHFPGLDIRVLPFEQLHIRHREVMEAFVDWMGIKWHGNLIISTLHGKLWWGNGKILRNGTNPEWKIYKPSGILERKDWRVFCTLLFDRMKMCGYITNPKKEVRLKWYSMLAALLLPTATEWSILKSTLSLRHWIGVVSSIIEELRNPQLKGFDFLSKKKLSEANQTFRSDSNSKIIFIKRVSERLYFHMRYMVNPILWFKYVLKRIYYFYGFANEYNGREEKLPVLLLK